MNHTLSFTHPALEEVSRKEWVVTNGIGGYSASTLCGMNTRRYHGLLVASLNPPTERKVIVSRIEETAHLPQGSYELSTNQYPGTIAPKGYQHIADFSRTPFPQTTFSIEGITLNKSIFMPQGSNTTVIVYKNDSSTPLSVDFRPHTVDRDYHSLLTDTQAYPYQIEVQEDHIQLLSQQESLPIYMGYSTGEFREDPSWYYNLEYQVDLERGQDFVEHSFQPGSLHATIEPGEEIFIVLTLDPNMLKEDPKALRQKEEERLADLVPASHNAPFTADMIRAADQFLVARSSTNSATIIAGYPWFTDWGRDTMIALRGLTLAMGKQAETRSIIETFLEYLDQGMLPNRFPDNGEIPEYNTVDATLWLFVVLYEYVQKFGDWAFIEEVFPQLNQIINAHIEGTRFDIHVNNKGFLFAGNRNTQLTWMDARMWGHAFTPRWGCPVEINALWFNALKIFAHFAEELHESAGATIELSKRFKRNFRAYFLNAQGYLNDTLVPDEWVDDSFRPNQVYALSLPFPLLGKKEGKRMLSQVKEKLVTPYGLRTLSTDHPDFKPFYQGAQWERDGAYHQGTVWPFLLGEYFKARIQVAGFSPALKAEIESGLEALKAHFYEEGCINGISEIFDGISPQQGKGTFHQAWSLSTLLDVMLEYRLFEQENEAKEALLASTHKPKSSASRSSLKRVSVAS